MKRGTKRTGAMLGVLVASAVLAQEPPVRVLGLMKSVIIPASDAVFGVGKAVPKTEREWAAVENGANRLIEAGKTLAAEAPAAGGDNWVKLANALSAAATVAAGAAKSKNADAVLDAGDTLYTTCEDCHRQYVKK